MKKKVSDAIKGTASKNDEKGETTKEIAKALGVSTEKALALLHEYEEQGVLGVGRAKRPYLDGTMRLKTVFWLNLPEERKSK